MRALVTGADGFVGRWLVRHLEQNGDEVWSLTGQASSGTRTQAVDIRDVAGVRAAVVEAGPEVAYHLAAVAYGPDASHDIDSAMDITVTGTQTLLAACAALPRPPLVLIASSSEVYAPRRDRALVETDLVGPVSTYGATKLAQEAIGFAYHLAGDVEVAVTRAFNHIGPGQREQFVAPAFATQLAEIAAGRRHPVLEVGNLDAIRDFTDVRDTVAAYRLVTQIRCTGRPLNVATGSRVRIGDLLARLIMVSGVEVDVVQDAARMRPNDAPLVVGDSGELNRLTGWSAQIGLDQTLHDVWEDARNRLPHIA